MGQIRKIKDIYYIEFYARGLLYSQVAGKDMGEAKKLLAQVEEKIAGGEALTISRYIDLPDFFARFLSEIAGQLGPKSTLRFTTTIEDLESFLKDNYSQIKQLDQLTPAVIESYKAYLVRSQKPKVVNLSILLIRDILEFGIKLGFLNDNPSLHVRLLPWPARPDRRSTARYAKAKHLLLQGVSLSKLALLLKLPDIARTIYFSKLIPLCREDAYN